jgi:glycine betaine/choline ABC-type transport system substrate-binding protein
VNIIDNIMKRIYLIVLIISLGFLLGCPSAKEPEQKSITIGSKHFTEQEILGEIMAVLIEEKTDITVVRKLNLGGTMVCFNALRTGDIDLYAEYTGTGLVNILNKKSIPEPDEVYRTVKETFSRQFHLIWLKPFGFNNTYTLTMRKDDADSMNIKAISDIIPYKNKLVPGFDAEFLERQDGYKGLIKHYGFEFGERPRQMDPGLMYKALAEGAVDVIDGFATDGRIMAYNLMILEDNKDFFPPYYAAPLVRQETILRYPEIKKLLNRLAGLIDDQTMQKLNYQVDKKEMNPREVAREFLKSKQLLK